MSMEEKNLQIQNYINQLAVNVNKDYPELLNKDRIDRAIQMYKDSDKELDDIYKEIDSIMKQLIEQRQEQIKRIEELKGQIKEVPKESPYFGEVYKAYITHVLALYESIENSSLSNDEKKQIFEEQLKQYLSDKNVEMNKLLAQQIIDPVRAKYGQSELFLGSNSLNYETVSNLYQTYINDINIVSNDSEGKMYCTVPNNQQLFDANGNLNPNIQYNFDMVKEIYDFAQQHGKQIKFHTFLWHNAVPENLKNEVEKVSDLSKRRDMIKAFLNDYASKLSSFMIENEYDLRQIEGLNEIANDEFPTDGIDGKEGDFLRQSWWRDVLGDQYYLDTLKILKRNFPNTEIIYNEYNEFIPYKATRIAKIMETIKAEELRCRKEFPHGFCDGLGGQGHVVEYFKVKGMNTPIAITEEMALRSAITIQQACQSPFGNKKFYITEKDRKNIGNSHYVDDCYMDTFTKMANGFIVWGNSDQLTWSFTKDPKTNEVTFGHMIDSNGKPKEGWNEVRDTFAKTKKIEMTDELGTCLDDIVQTSLLTSREALEKYSSNSNFAMQMQRAQEQGKVLLAQLQQLRQSNPNMTDAVFYQNAMASFLTPVIQKISMEYGQIIPQEKLQRLQGLMNPQNITFSNDPNQNDIQANSEKGTIVINPQKTNGTTLEEKIVSSMSVSIHESFHLIVNMLKSSEQAEALGERLMYTVTTQDGDKEVHFAPGKYGQVLSEGFVEKLSSEFAKKNGFFYTLNPSYVPYVNLCTQLMKQDKSIDIPTLFTTNGDRIVDKMSPEVKTKFESAERLAVINNFSVKEAKKEPSLKGITSENVKSSWMEVNDKKVSVSDNTTYRKPLESTEKKQEEHSETKSVESKSSISRGPETKSFSWKSNSETMIYRQIKQKNQMIKQQKAQQKQMNKPKVKTLTPPSQGVNGSKGFTNVITLSLIVSFVAGALFMVMYMLLNK